MNNAHGLIGVSSPDRGAAVSLRRDPSMCESVCISVFS